VQRAPLAGHGRDPADGVLAVTVYSTQLGSNATINTSGSTIYTVPAGKRTIVKSLAVANFFAGANNAVIAYFHGATLLGYHNVHLATAGSSGDTEVSQPYVVLNAGDSIKVTPSNNGVAVLASGSELTL
jgi:hypothetical protein